MTPAQLYSLAEGLLGVEKCYLAGNGWVRGCCPLHAETNPSFGIDTTRPEHPYFCFRCGGGSLVWLVRRVRDVTEEKALRLIGKYGDVMSVPVNPVQFGMFGQKRRSWEIPPHMIAPYEGKGLRVCERVVGFRAGYLKRFRLGFDKKRKRVVFPWFFDGKLVCVTGRLAVKSDAPKTIPYFGSPKGDWLYLPHGRFHGRETVLVEGEKDALSLARINVCAAATGHAGITQTQAEIILDNSPRVVVFADPDEGGERYIVSARKRLAGKVPLFVVGHSTKDAGACRITELQSALHHRTRLA